MQLLTLLEDSVSKTDHVDQVGINDHLRQVWAFRDALNEYFHNGCDFNALMNPPVIADGMGGVWSATCHSCQKDTMQVVRPGKVQCTQCG